MIVLKIYLVGWLVALLLLLSFSLYFNRRSNRVKSVRFYVDLFMQSFASWLAVAIIVRALIEEFVKYIKQRRSK